MRGVGYATIEIIVLILLGAIIGFLIGWILRRFLYNVDLTSYENRVRNADAARVSAQAEVAAAKERLAAASDDLAALQAEMADVEANAGALTADLDAARQATGAADGRIEALESELTGLRAEIDATTETAASKDGRIEELESEVAGVRADLDAALAVAGEKEAAIGRLEADLAGLASLREESDAKAARISELEVLVVEKDASVDTDRIATLEAAIDDAERELAACRDRVVDRDARIAALEARAAEPAPAPATTTTGTPTAEVELPSREDAVVAMAEIATRTAGDGPAVDDDLKKIHGVGPKLEQLLKRMGITSFQQVARFEADDIAVVTAALDAFPGRIERDDWMSSAAEEHEKKYGK